MLSSVRYVQLQVIQSISIVKHRAVFFSSVLNMEPTKKRPYLSQHHLPVRPRLPFLKKKSHHVHRVCLRIRQRLHQLPMLETDIFWKNFFIQSIKWTFFWGITVVSGDKSRHKTINAVLYKSTTYISLYVKGKWHKIINIFIIHLSNEYKCRPYFVLVL